MVKIMENKCPHCDKLPSDPIANKEELAGPFWFEKNPAPFISLGCSSGGFCHNCNIFYWDSICMCMGKTCYKCEQHVNARSAAPKDLPDGIYEYRCWHTTEMREYKGGIFGKTISKTRLPGNEWMDKK
jgi:hypothetical protein